MIVGHTQVSVTCSRMQLESRWLMQGNVIEQSVVVARYAMNPNSPHCRVNSNFPSRFVEQIMRHTATSVSFKPTPPMRVWTIVEPAWMLAMW